MRSTRIAARNFIPQQLLLDQNPVFYEYFRIPKSHSYFPVMGRPSKPVLSFLILGLGAGLNANYHCEEGPNWYMAVSGSKRWTLIEAEYSWLLYPAALGNGMRRFAAFKADEQGEPKDRDAYPLMEYAPRYEFELHPGDVLFFPAWMWHKTINLNEEGLGSYLSIHRPNRDLKQVFPRHCNCFRAVSGKAALKSLAPAYAATWGLWQTTPLTTSRKQRCTEKTPAARSPCL